MIPLHGQILHANGPLPSFEVASIRPWKPNPSPPPSPANISNAPQKSNERFAPLGGGAQKTDRVHAILPANLLITFAYGLRVGSENRILGAPDWASSEQYEIQAKIEDSLFATMQTMAPAQQRDQVALMEQSLLADRFKMKVHFETREMNVYALVNAKGGSELTPAKEGEVPKLSVVDVDQGLQMTAKAVTIDDWIHSPFMGGRTVVDQTGLKGAYDFQVTWGRPQPVASDAEQDRATAPPLLTAIQEQLGLKLVPTKAQIEVIVVDHIERPSAN
jgi:bla regulator protein blaR1